jgi:tRNA A-37 threonylcarbamoyl transferase component Bud32
MTFIKRNVSFAEYNMQQMIYNKHIVNIPEPYTYDKEAKELTMENIPAMSVADYYGDNFNTVPQHIIKEIRDIIRKLSANGINYPDITGYNFIEWSDKIWIIDFEHAHLKDDKYSFMQDFIDGYNGWNPDFA